MRPKFPGWCNATEERLQQLVEAGGTSATIAAELGTTTNTILGKIDRMGLVLKGARKAAGVPRRVRDGGSWNKATRAAATARTAADYNTPSPPRRFSWQEPLDGASEPA